MLFGGPGTQTSIPDVSTGGAGFEVGKFSEDGYWKVDNDAGTLIDGEYTIKVSAEEFAPLSADITKLTLVKRVSAGDWFCPGTHLAPTGDLITTTLGRSGVSGFSNFGFASEIDAPLAIELAAMNLNCSGSYPSFSWSTLKESDSRSFIIQESANGRNWSVLGKVNAAGNSSNLKKYSFVLEQLDAQSTMVRLVLVNASGPDQIFNPVNIPCNRSLIKANIELYPNPNQGTFVIDLKQTSDEILEIFVMNMLGQNVYGKLHNANRNSKVNMDLKGLPSGMYQVVIKSSSGENEIQNLRVLVK